MKQLEDKVAKFPKKPGVYLFKDNKGEVIYVGKAKSLKVRVGSYFKKPKEKGAKVEFLLRRAKDIDFIVTDNEKEALLLENNLIKKYKPRYNIQLKDDKTYVSIRIGLDHEFPGISILRRVLKDGAAYFGPFTSSVAARHTVDQVIRSFRIRSCRDTEFSNRVRPCLEFDLGRCRAPCVGKVSKKDYKECIEEALLFLKGESKELIQKLTRKMNDASLDTNYEEAGHLRDLIGNIKDTLTRQKVVMHGGGDQDAIGFEREGDLVALCILMVKSGVLLDRRVSAKSGVYGEDDRILESFILEHYVAGQEIPPKIILSQDLEGRQALASILSDRRGKKVKLIVPKRGTDLEIVELALSNAKQAIKTRAAESKDVEEILMLLQKKLGLAYKPETIECLDITNLMGKEAYGSLVVFVRGRPEKNRYRLYGIKTLKTPDDYAMMHEVLERRYAKIKSDAKFEEPDLLLIDGGKGQLNVARKVLDDLGFKDLPVASIAKAKEKEEEDKVYIVGRKNPLTFKKGNPALLLMKRIRDEAHRFGITRHRRRRVREFFDPSTR